MDCMVVVVLGRLTVYSCHHHPEVKTGRSSKLWVGLDVDRGRVELL